MPVAYLEETPPGWSAEIQRTWRIEEEPDRVRLHGPCPTCGDRTETVLQEVTTVPGSTPDSGRKGTRPGQQEPLLVVCACEEEHAGRPSGRHGCGRAGYLTLVRT